MQLGELAYAIATFTLILSIIPELRTSASIDIVDTAKIFPMRRDSISVAYSGQPSHQRE